MSGGSAGGGGVSASTPLVIPSLVVQRWQANLPRGLGGGEREIGPGSLWRPADGFLSEWRRPSSTRQGALLTSGCQAPCPCPHPLPVSLAVCQPPCQNRGSCSRPQLCVCRSGFRGARCEEVIPEEEFDPQNSRPAPRRSAEGSHNLRRSSAARESTTARAQPLPPQLPPAR